MAALQRRDRLHSPPLPQCGQQQTSAPHADVLQKELSSSPQAVAATLRKMVGRPRAWRPNARRVATFSGLGRVDPDCAQTDWPCRRFWNASRKIPDFHRIPSDPRNDCSTVARRGASDVSAFMAGSIPAKGSAVAAFRGDGKRNAGVRVMVSTESGAEGRNLQFCHLLINYDLPWNPMRVEQRIGRLHRLGQEQRCHDLQPELQRDHRSRTLSNCWRVRSACSNWSSANST